jgi:hypothetical protein
MLRPTQRFKRQLLKALDVLAQSMNTRDLEMLKELQLCPDSSKAIAILTDALAHSSYRVADGECLLPEASWIHPLT